MVSLMYGLLSTFIYVLIVAVLVLASRDQYKLSSLLGDKRTKMALVTILVASLAFSLLNKFCTECNDASSYGGDRLNYLQDFYGRRTGYEGFDLYLRMANAFIGDYNVTLYLTTFLCCFVMLAAYKESDLATPEALAFVFASNFVFFTFTGLRQALAGIFVNIFFVLMLSEKKSLAKDLLCILLAIVSVQFHITGYILLPIYLLLKLNYNNGWKSAVLFIALILILFFMEPILRQLARISSGNISILANKINDYMTQDASQASESGLSLLKGLPYYFLTYYAASRRKEMTKIIPYYDKYLVISGIASMFALSTIISYWFSRFTLLFIFPCSILYCILLQGEQDKKRSQLLKFAVIAPLLLFTLRANLLVFINYGGY